MAKSIEPARHQQVIEITPKRNLFTLNLHEIWRYRDLLYLLVHRDFVAVYKQTVLGPLWFFVQPVFTSLIFTVIFGRLAGISTDGVPPMLFYLAGITLWNYFKDCVMKTSSTFKDNQHIFGKVYFPRLVSPISVVVSNLLKFAIQFALFMAFYFYFAAKGAGLQPQWQVFLAPLLVLMISGLGLGLGILITSLTTKYRDLTFLLEFGIQLFMYATPVIYPLSTVPDKYRNLAVLNPMTSIIETFKAGFLGSGTFSWWHLAYSFGFMAVTLFLGILVFNKTEQNFMDTV